MSSWVKRLLSADEDETLWQMSADTVVQNRAESICPGNQVVSPDHSLAKPSSGRLLFLPVYRLRKTDEYSSVFAFRRTVRGQYFVLHFRPIDQQGRLLDAPQSARLGTVVAKKLAHSAVTRNLIKRLAREHFRHIRDTLPSYDLVLRLAKPIAKATRLQLREDIAFLLARLPK